MLITSAGYKRDRNNFSNLSGCYVNLPKAQFSIYVEYCLQEKLANWLVIKRKLGSQPRTKPLTENQIASFNSSLKNWKPRQQGKFEGNTR